jgi:Reverse gyrase
MTPTLAPCTDCGKQVSASATACPNCGRKLKSTPINILATIILCVICLFVAGAIVSVIGGSAPIQEHSKASKPNKDGVYCDADGHWHGLK